MQSIATAPMRLDKAFVKFDGSLFKARIQIQKIELIILMMM